MLKSLYTKLALSAAILVGAVFAFNSTPMQSQAAVNNPTAKPIVSFTFDDGLYSTLSLAGPALAQYGYSGTSYVIGNCVETVGICNADPEDTYLTWAQVAQLQNQYGWEIGGHSLTHPLMTEITPTQLENEASQSKAILESHGFSPVSFATPYGDYNDKVIAAIAKYYTSHRGFADIGYNTWPNDNYILRVQQVQAGVSVNTVKGYIDQAKANNTWLILVFHDIKTTPSTDPEEYEYSVADLSAIAAYVKAQNITVKNVKDALVTSDTNLIQNSSFDTNLNGWTTNNALKITVDNGGNGMTTGYLQSAKITADTTNVSLFSAQVAVNPQDIYVIKSYLNVVNTFATGEVALYVDEYDTGGNWISGQYKDAVRFSYDKEISTVYVASSNNVASASLQVIVTGGSGITAYVDNVRWFATTSTPPTPTPTPTGTNLLNNPEFDQGLTGWSTNSSTTIVADAASHGASSGPVNSVRFSAATSNTYLFAPMVNVTATTTYNLSAFVNVTALNSGEVAFYIDEYNTSGSWISGQYKTARRSIGSQTTQFTYIPSSANVTKASLQFIIVGGSGAQGYIDAVQWLDPSVTTPPPTVIAPVNTVLPTLSGSFVEGQTITVSNGTWNNTPTAYAYTWSKCLNNVCTPLTGTTNSIVVTAAEVGYSIKASVTASNTAGSATSDTAQSTAVTALPVVTPPTNTNLMTNGQFDLGLSGGWTTDSPTLVTFDTASHGAVNGPVNCIKLVAGTTNVHLFSPKVTVASTTTYTIDTFLDITARTSGLIAYYVDEYNASGTWISGKYITASEKAAIASGRVSFTYTPSSANVASASLQVIVTANSGITAYFDDVNWN